jgi:hypothetical protein
MKAQESRHNKLNGTSHMLTHLLTSSLLQQLTHKYTYITKQTSPYCPHIHVCLLPTHAYASSPKLQTNLTLLSTQPRMPIPSTCLCVLSKTPNKTHPIVHTATYACSQHIPTPNTPTHKFTPKHSCTTYSYILAASSKRPTARIYNPNTITILSRQPPAHPHSQSHPSIPGPRPGIFWLRFPKRPAAHGLRKQQR